MTTPDLDRDRRLDLAFRQVAPFFPEVDAQVVFDDRVENHLLGITATGSSETIVVGPAALERFDDRQLRAALAHELAHRTGRRFLVWARVEPLARRAVPIVVGLVSLGILGAPMATGPVAVSGAGAAFALGASGVAAMASSYGLMAASGSLRRRSELRADRVAAARTGLGDALSSVLLLLERAVDGTDVPLQRASLTARQLVKGRRALGEKGRSRSVTWWLTLLYERLGASHPSLRSRRRALRAAGLVAEPHLAHRSSVPGTRRSMISAEAFDPGCSHGATTIASAVGPVGSQEHRDRFVGTARVAQGRPGRVSVDLDLDLGLDPRTGPRTDLGL